MRLKPNPCKKNNTVSVLHSSGIRTQSLTSVASSLYILNPYERSFRSLRCLKFQIINCNTSGLYHAVMLCVFVRMKSGVPSTGEYILDSRYPNDRITH